MGGIRCLACRRYVLGWPHLLLLLFLILLAVYGILELHYYLSKPTPLQKL